MGYFAAGEAERLQLVVSGAGVLVAFLILLFGAQFLASALVRMARRLRPRTSPGLDLLRSPRMRPYEVRP